MGQIGRRGYRDLIVHVRQEIESVFPVGVRGRHQREVSGAVTIHVCSQGDDRSRNTPARVIVDPVVIGVVENVVTDAAVTAVAEVHILNASGGIKDCHV